jgi:hypothetical protein
MIEFNVLVGDIDPESQGAVHSDFHAAFPGRGDLGYRSLSMKISVAAALLQDAQMADDEARIGMAIDQRGARVQVAPAQDVDRKVVANGCAQDPIEAGVVWLALRLLRQDNPVRPCSRLILEKLLKNEGHMPEDKFLVMSRKGKRLGVAYVSTPRGEGGARSLKFKTK